MTCQPVMDCPVTLVIKAPNQKYDDQTINCFLDWTVEKLKSHLSKVYPSKPSAKDQRLVYSGKLLLDHLLLKDVLRKQDEYHMVHLVCASRTPPSSPKASKSSKSMGTSSSGRSSSSGSANPGSTSQDTSSTYPDPRPGESIRHRHTPLMYNNLVHSHPYSYLRQEYALNPPPGQEAPSIFPAYSAFTPLQMMWWQQLYARQYYIYSQATASNQSTSNGENAQPVPRPVTNSENPPPNPPRAPPNVAPEINPNIQMNAQGGPVMNEEDINRDWLDWIYTVSRAAILLSIVYFYSSFSRFVMVMGALILVYMHQAGWFPLLQDEGQQHPGDNAAEVNPDLVNNNDPQELERRMDDGLQEVHNNDAGVNVVARQGVLASAWSFITTFFTSLIPEGPPQGVN
ncbi:homocysteine-responsive endoplasmic reticulum-resident ubiquitin-like domain member 2 protein [Xenopus laevis]|uniref:Homocysteine-responsive endoplasmic reticulum-resident ubiquitin-like domain member 2 protein n=2 Tax=Xenopus laevis TaxID=8355 RepID=HERP2_XENLA|nr:homocysteine-responsive endoplasmic reticulum-resident ubiquitin-like domain member 2 protein [Xenopus laevis]Q7ZXQ3.1 RecName: Full=Homocysteine-responsive endoplasmic reticulum-resident ubiquitin-like domain member 2 protein [Xenopus laevis]AAH44318.1 MGC52715 protein [Xenopus laevis]OCT76099.1 hypothetical protein XELAEV_18031287mg [Xenopus laevis]